MITHVLDASAVLAHFFQEPGADQVNALLADNTAEIGFAAVSLVELRAKLFAAVSDPQEAERAFHLYADELMAVLPVTREVAELANEILRAGNRVLTVPEAIVAATAKKAGAVLVHCAPGLAGLPSSVITQWALPLETH